MLAILTTHPIQYQVPLWQALARDGRVPFEVWYLTSHAVQQSHDREFGSSFAWDIDLLSGYRYRLLRTALGATPNTFWRCRVTESFPALFKETNTKAVWIQGWQVAAYWQAVWKAKAAGVEVWMRGESNDLAPVPWWKRSIKRLVLGQLFKRVDRFFYIGSANRRLYEKFGVPKGKLFPAPYAVDNERFRLQAEAIRGQRSVVRSRWSIPEESFCILFCGKFIPKKRPMDIVEAAKLLMQSTPDMKVHLLFAGSGELGAQLRAACNVVYDAEAGQASVVSDQRSAEEKPTSDIRPLTSEAKPRASFAGFLNQTEVSRAYVAADVLVLPSDYGETWGLVVNEATASGLPSIISDRCGCAEDLGDNPNTTYPCGKTESLATAITRTKGSSFNPEDLLRILSQHSLKNTIDSVAEIYSPNS